MLKRKIEKELYNWKMDKGHKPLIVKGLRQSGKSYSVLEFANKNYANVIYINFQTNEDYKKIFENNLDVENLKMQISAYFTDAKFEEGKTIIILDEIQECSRARLALKFFKLDGRYDVIATGSLLGIRGLNDDVTSVPVGYEEELKMFPLDFEEFLWAMGINEEIIEELKKCLIEKRKVAEGIHQKMKELLLQYIIVGGMPEAVQKFIETNNLNDVNKIKANILSSYKDDMVKYVDVKDKTKINECFESIPYQLAKENKKFKYNVVKNKATKNDYAGVLEWLENFGIIKRCFNLTRMEKPLGAYVEENKFKVYMADIGLLISMIDENVDKEILSGNLNIYKGAIYENLYADFLIKNEKPLYYFTRETSLEIDFVMNYENEVTLVEVKANTGNAKSLKTVLNDKKRYDIDKALKFGDYNIGYVNNVLTLPLYMGFLVKN